VSAQVNGVSQPSRLRDCTTLTACGRGQTQWSGVTVPVQCSSAAAACSSALVCVCLLTAMLRRGGEGVGMGFGSVTEADGVSGQGCQWQTNSQRPLCSRPTVPDGPARAKRNQTDDTSADEHRNIRNKEQPTEKGWGTLQRCSLAPHVSSARHGSRTDRTRDASGRCKRTVWSLCMARQTWHLDNVSMRAVLASERAVVA